MRVVSISHVVSLSEEPGEVLHMHTLVKHSTQSLPLDIPFPGRSHFRFTPKLPISTTFPGHLPSFQLPGGPSVPHPLISSLRFTHYDCLIQDMSFASPGTGIDYDYPKDPKLVLGTNYPSGALCFPVDG